MKLSQKTDIPLKGEIAVAPDKSISHRSLIFAALAQGKTKITNLLEGEDVLCTAQALRLMGCEIEQKIFPARPTENFWEVNGVGVAGLSEPADILDMGNSGTAARLLAGLVTPYNFTSFFTGDASLRKRPMGRVFEPIKQFGAKIISRQNGLMPFAIIGAKEAMPIAYEMKIASAQVKSCILLASLATRGATTIIEPEKCRDHTEIMMRYLGLKISNEGKKISYSGLQEFDAKDLAVPGDISSAAFFIVAALLVKNSQVVIKNVGVNPLRTGIITCLQEMGGKISFLNEREVGGEKVADILVEASELKGIEVPANRAASMIDEYPIFAVAAANAKGVTKMNGLAELKVKESNRLLMIAHNLEKCGVTAKMGDDYLEVQGKVPGEIQGEIQGEMQGGVRQKKSPAKIITSMDHRIAMSFLIMGLTMEGGVEIDDASMIKTSFPNFESILDSFL